MRTRASTWRRQCPCGYCAPLREARRRLLAGQNHPHYVAGPFKEQPLLEELIAAEPPVGGVAAYVADFNGEYDPSEE